MGGGKIEYTPEGTLRVPGRPIIPYIEGDGVGPDIWKASVRVFDAAVQTFYGGKRKVEWLEVFAGEKAFRLKGDWAPKETIETIRDHKVAIKGPRGDPRDRSQICESGCDQSRLTHSFRSDDV